MLQDGQLSKQLEMAKQIMEQRERENERIIRDLRKTIAERESSYNKMREDFITYQSQETVALTMTLREDFEVIAARAVEIGRRRARDVREAEGIDGVGSVWLRGWVSDSRLAQLSRARLGSLPSRSRTQTGSCMPRPPACCSADAACESEASTAVQGWGVVTRGVIADKGGGARRASGVREADRRGRGEGIGLFGRGGTGAGGRAPQGERERGFEHPPASCAAGQPAPLP